MILCVCPNPSIDTVLGVESFSPGRVNRVLEEKRYPGGKGIHVALALAELGKATAVAGIWAGPTGEWIRNESALRGVECIGPHIDNGWSRSCFTFYTSDCYHETEILGVGPEITTGTVSELVGIVETYAQKNQVSALALSGSWPRGGGNGRFSQLARIGRKKGFPVYIDCTGDELTDVLYEEPAGVHLNQSEASQITGESDPQVSARILATKARLVVITSGRDGAFFARGGEILHALCSIENPLGSVGCGDCLLAGLISAEIENSSLSDVARWSVACGAANCLRPELGMLHRRDVEKLFPNVKIKKIP